MAKRTAEAIRKAATERLVRQATSGLPATPPEAGQDEEAGIVVDGELVQFGRLDITPLTDGPGEAGGFVLA